MITDPSQLHFKDGLWAWDAAASAWVKLLADANGYLRTSLDADTIGLATSARQDTMITALQLIDDLRNALNSVATDALDVVLDGQNVDVEVTQTTPADLTPGLMGWDGSAWRKLPLLWGYSDSLWTATSDTATAAATLFLIGDTVPAQEVWVINTISWYRDTNAGQNMRLSVYTAGAYVNLTDYTVPATNTFYKDDVESILKAGERLRFGFAGATIGEYCEAHAWGYTMKVAE